MKHLLLLMTLPLAAQNLAGPTSGYVLDANALRPIVGIPGAAYLGDPLISNAKAAAVSPDGKNAIVNIDGTLVALSGIGGELRSQVIASDFGEASAIAWDATSASAAIAGAGRAALFTKDGLEAIDAPAGKITAIALANDAIAAAVEGTGVMLLKRGAAPQLLSRGDAVSSLALAGNDLYFTDSARGQILKIENFAEGGDATVFASGLDGASGVAAAKGKLLVSTRGGQSVTAFRLSTGELLASVALGFEPSSLARLSDGLWLLNSGASPVQLVDENLQTWFVPAGTADR